MIASVSRKKVMFSQNGKRPIWTNLRGSFPHAEEKQL
jgi:hypothetical protein